MTVGQILAVAMLGAVVALFWMIGLRIALRLRSLMRFALDEVGFEGERRADLMIDHLNPIDLLLMLFTLPIPGAVGVWVWWRKNWTLTRCAVWWLEAMLRTYWLKGYLTLQERDDMLLAVEMRTGIVVMVPQRGITEDEFAALDEERKKRLRTRRDGAADEERRGSGDSEE